MLRVAGVGVCGDRVSRGGGGGRSGETGVGGWTRSNFQLHTQWDFWGAGSRVTGRTGCRGAACRGLSGSGERRGLTEHHSGRAGTGWKRNISVAKLGDSGDAQM